MQECCIDIIPVKHFELLIIVGAQAFPLAAAVTSELEHAGIKKNSSLIQVETEQVTKCPTFPICCLRQPSSLPGLWAISHGSGGAFKLELLSCEKHCYCWDNSLKICWIITSHQNLSVDYGSVSRRLLCDKKASPWRVATSHLALNQRWPTLLFL